jgi:hypothetical protein
MSTSDAVVTKMDSSVREALDILNVREVTLSLPLTIRTPVNIDITPEVISKVLMSIEMCASQALVPLQLTVHTPTVIARTVEERRYVTLTKPDAVHLIKYRTFGADSRLKLSGFKVSRILTKLYMAATAKAIGAPKINMSDSHMLRDGASVSYSVEEGKYIVVGLHS